MLIDIVNAHGVVILQTIWATSPDVVAGHRLTRVERVDDPTLMLARLRELVLTLYRPITLAAAA